MWIAKPISALSDSEKRAWLELEERLPLAQTLHWASATEAVAGKTYLVFSPDEKAGGIVFSAQDLSRKGSLKFECVNGPLLDWDDPQKAPRQFATFATAVSKLDPRFESLSVRPRWETGLLEKRLKNLPISIYDSTKAATQLITVFNDPPSQLASFSVRLRRTLTKTWKNPVTTQSEEATPNLLKPFVSNLNNFGALKKFTVPPLNWFEALVQPRHTHPDIHSSKYWIITADTLPYSRAQLLICIRKHRAHYLFGFEQRDPLLKAAISISAAAHWEALRLCASLNIDHYDLNGALVDPDASHPYFGVDQFKGRFLGVKVGFDIPEFVIE